MPFSLTRQIRLHGRPTAEASPGDCAGRHRPVRLEAVSGHLHQRETVLVHTGEPDHRRRAATQRTWGILSRTQSDGARERLRRSPARISVSPATVAVQPSRFSERVLELLLLLGKEFIGLSSKAGSLEVKSHREAGALAHPHGASPSSAAPLLPTDTLQQLSPQPHFSHNQGADGRVVISFHHASIPNCRSRTPTQRHPTTAFYRDNTCPWCHCRDRTCAEGGRRVVLRCPLRGQGRPALLQRR